MHNLKLKPKLLKEEDPSQKEENATAATTRRPISINQSCGD